MKRRRSPRIAVWRDDRQKAMASVVETYERQWRADIWRFPHLDPKGEEARGETFPTVELALDFVGHPWRTEGIPPELE